MAKKDWVGDEQLDPIGSFLSQWSDSQQQWDINLFKGLAGRRKKAAFLLITIWITVIGLHLVNWGHTVIVVPTALISFQLFRMLTSKPDVQSYDMPISDYPIVSLIVAAKNEEAVVASLVNQLCTLDYPAQRYEVWIINDNSTDKTSQILDSLSYPQLRVVHRSADSTGGKSGALNQVLPLTKGTIIGVFDADARINSDLLKKVAPLFQPSDIGAIQLRKSIINSEVNFLTAGQSTEMALDSFYQQRRIACGGLGELRGNGQFVRRIALERSGGWNEETITDDLDLTIRLHLDKWKIGFCLDPQVEEEGVTTATALWHQRNRWAEGGYQRYLDYWRLLLSQPMGLKKKIDLFTFLFVQYIIPTSAVPDLLMSITGHGAPLLTPLTAIIFMFSFFGMWRGLKNESPESGNTQLLFNTIKGTIYMMHWFFIIPSVTARLSVRPKSLKWIKTSHIGNDELELIEGGSQT